MGVVDIMLDENVLDGTKPVISMSTLGTNGRFGNQLFQYAYIKIYAKVNDLQVEVPDWIGRYIFGHDDAKISKQLTLVKERAGETKKPSKYFEINTLQPLQNVDIWGYYQYHTKYYSPYKEYFRVLFKPVPDMEKPLKHIINQLRIKGNTIVSLHIRRGDYNCYSDTSYAYYVPTEWYKEWLKRIWKTLDKPLLYIASDDLEKVLPDFAEYSPISRHDLIFPSDLDFFVDFYLLCHAEVLAISNSTFSFVASMLNEKAKQFLRPHRPTNKLISFDPWNSLPLLRGDTT